MLKKIMGDISTYSADYGGTEIFNPIESATKLNTQEYKKRIFLLTDGDVSSPEKVIKHIELNCDEDNDHTRVFTFGIGSGCNKYLVEGSAKAGKGKHYLCMENEMD